MNVSKPVTFSNTKSIVIKNASHFLNENELKDKTSSLAGLVQIEAVDVDPILSKHKGEVLYKQTFEQDYVLQPKQMLHRGSMCVSELYGTST